MSFHSDERLKNSREFDALFNHGEKLISRHFVVLYQSNLAEHTRLGVVASKKNFRRAVLRNKIKRLVRESFRHAKTLLPNLDVVVVGRHSLQHLTNDIFFEEINKVWDKLKCAKSSSA